MRKIKILHIIKTLNLGGAEANLLNLIQAMDPERFENHAAYSFGGEMEERFRASPVKLFKYADGNHKLKSLHSAAIIARLAAYIKKQRIDIVHTHNFNAHLWGLAAAKLAGVQVVEHVHDMRYMPLEELQKRRGVHAQFRFIRFFKNKSDCVLVLTRQNETYLLENHFYPPEKIRQARNGVPLPEPAKIEETRAEARDAALHRLGIAPWARVILTPARVAPEKNIDLIFEVASTVMREVPEAVFVIAGDGPLLEEFEKKAADRKFKGGVRLPGFFSDTAFLMARADIFFLPSFLELHSIALLEAMSMKVPAVISAGVGCHEEFIRNWHNGVLLDPFSSEGWAGALVRLLKEESLRRSLAENAFRTCVEQFDVRQAAGKMGEVYAELTH